MFKFISTAIILCVSCAPLVPSERPVYSDHYVAPDSRLVGCNEDLSNCYHQANMSCTSGWHMIAVGTNLPSITKQGSGYYFWIECDRVIP
jgi:hypothetical protein